MSRYMVGWRQARTIQSQKTLVRHHQPTPCHRVRVSWSPTYRHDHEKRPNVDGKSSFSEIPREQARLHGSYTPIGWFGRGMEVYWDRPGHVVPTKQKKKKAIPEPQVNLC